MTKKTAPPKKPAANGAPPKKQKQAWIEGMEPPKVKEIEDAADKLDDVRRRRIALTNEETNLADTLLLLMHKYDFRVYEYDGRRVEIEALEKIKVRKAKEGDGE